MLRFNRLTIKAGEKVIVRNLSYDFQLGKIYAIMGPNGSGKSTLALAAFGHPDYIIKEGQIYFKNQKINRLSAEKRARLGMFLSFQNPPALTGISVFQLLRLAVAGQIEPLTLKNKIDRLANELKINHDLIVRPLNAGASGGERKKLELLQGLILGRPVMVFDEIDTGVDIDSLRHMAQAMKKYQPGHTYILITHYNRILKFLKPDRVLVIKFGHLVQEGGWELAETVERQGYEKII